MFRGQLWVGEADIAMHRPNMHAPSSQVQRWIGVMAGRFPAVVDGPTDDRAASGAVQCIVTLDDEGQAHELYEYVFPWFVRVPAPPARGQWVGQLQERARSCSLARQGGLIGAHTDKQASQVLKVESEAG